MTIKMQRKPDFFIVGAPKCGTTAFHRYLMAHPEIFMAAKKESHFFSTDITSHEHIRDLASYLSLFDSANQEKRIGEASVWYLASREAAYNIHEFNPDARIIVFLRNPLEMIPSLHSQLIFNGYENIRDLREALNAENERRRGERVPRTASAPTQLLYRDAARYTKQVQRYFDTFGQDRVHVILYDDIRGKLPEVYRELLIFLEVDSDFRPDFEKINTNKEVGSLFLRDILKNPPDWCRRLVRSIMPGEHLRHTAIKKLEAINVTQKSRKSMDVELKNQLAAEFREEVARLQDLLGRDLSHWLLLSL